MNLARQIGLQVHIVTQFCFEGEPIVAWLKRIRAMGVHLPVRIGLAGPAGIATLMRYAMHCGVGNSIRALPRSPRRSGTSFSPSATRAVIRGFSPQPRRRSLRSSVWHRRAAFLHLRRPEKDRRVDQHRPRPATPPQAEATELVRLNQNFRFSFEKQHPGRLNEKAL